MSNFTPAIELLTASSNTDPTVDRNDIVLRNHQSAALHACKRLERGQRPLPAASSPDPSNTCIRTRIGAYCDAPGAGKSYVMLALCADGGELLPEAARHVTLCQGRVSYAVRETPRLPKVRHVNIIVAPHGLVRQWIEYARLIGMTETAVIRVARRTDYAGLEARLDAAPNNTVVIVSSTCFRRFAQDHAHAKNALYDRLIVDEADSISLGSTDLPNARMTWMVTGSPAALLLPYASLSYCHQMGRYSRASSGVATRTIRSLFTDLMNHAPRTRGTLFVQNDPAFVAECTDVVEPYRAYVACRTPTSVRILSGIADRQIVEALNTDDEALAVSYLDSTSDVGNIVKRLHDGWTHRADLMRRLVEMPDLPDDMRIPAERKLALLLNQIENVDSRVRDASEDMCGICYEDRDDTHGARAVTPCCAAQYCFACVSKWVATNRTCPNCRNPLRPCVLHVLTSTPEADAPPPLPWKRDAAVDIARTVVAASPDARVMVVSCNELVFGEIMSGMSAAGLTCGRIRGTPDAIDASVRRFREGTNRVVCVASSNYAAGTNLEFVTDVIMYSRLDRNTEQQAVGRAQRLGRVGRLNVWLLVHATEDDDGQIPGSVSDAWNGITASRAHAPT